MLIPTPTLALVLVLTNIGNHNHVRNIDSSSNIPLRRPSSPPPSPPAQIKLPAENPANADTSEHEIDEDLINNTDEEKGQSNLIL